MRRRLLWPLAAAAAVVGAWAVVFAQAEHLSWFHGLYCSVGIASTNGCDFLPRDTSDQAVTVAVILTAVPVLGTVFARLTAHHTARRVHERSAAARADAAAARRIIADLYRHTTGERHPDHPAAPKEDPS